MVVTVAWAKAQRQDGTERAEGTVYLSPGAHSAVSAVLLMWVDFCSGTWLDLVGHKNGEGSRSDLHVRRTI